MSWCCYNGAFYSENTPLITIQNRAFKYGDGFFETMKFQNGRINLMPLHLERMALSMKLLKLRQPETGIENWMHMTGELCNKNNFSSARVRLEVFREEGDQAGFVIQAEPLPARQTLFFEGVSLDIYVHSRKSCDAFSNLKTANFLPYVMAALDAAEKGVDDCLLLNTENNICDSSKANLFLIKDGKVLTPALHQGCVSGVMRLHVINSLKQNGIPVYQQEISETELLHATGVFLTNAILEMIPVKRYKEKNYSTSRVLELRNLIFQQNS